MRNLYISGNNPQGKGKKTMKNWSILTFLGIACSTLAASTPQFESAPNWQKAPWHPGAKQFNCMKVENNVVTLSKSDATTLSFGPAKVLASDLSAGQKMRFSVDFKGSGAPKNYEYGMVLEIVYTDNTKEKWHQGSVFIKFPRKLDDFKTFTAQYTAAKPVKFVTVRFLFNGNFNVQLKNPKFELIGDSAQAAENAGNLLINTSFDNLNGKIQGWVISAKTPTTCEVKDGVINATVNASLLAVETDAIEPENPSAPIKFGFEADINAKPKSWRYMAVIDAVYADGSKSKWVSGMFKLKNTNGFAKFEAVFTPEKPVKNFKLKIFCEGSGTIKVRRPFAVTERSAKGAAPVVQSKAAAPAKAVPQTPAKTAPQSAVVPGNLAPNPGLIYKDGKLDGWSANPRYMSALDNGGFRVKLPAQAGFAIASQTIELNQTQPTTIRYGVSYMGKNFPVSYHHGMLLDKVVYMDGTTAGWDKTHFIFRFQSADWSRESTAWMPPKPVKSFRLYFIFKSTADAEFCLKDVFVKEDPNAFSTANANSNYDSTPTNLVSNGNFEIITAGDPKNWIPFYENHPLNMSLKKNITLTVDGKVKHSGKYSMCLSGSTDSIAGIESTVASIIDYTREFTFSGWVKAENATGNTFLEVKFLRNWAPCGIGSAAGNELNRVYHRADLVGVYRTPITSGTHDWKKLSVTMRPPAGANLVTFRVFSINNKGKVWIDDLEFDGFGNAPREILYSQLGYPADGTKTIILRSRQAVSGNFEVIAENGKSVFKGILRERAKDIWNCFNYEADFSDYTVPGKYTVRFNNSDGTYSSKSFEIRKDFYASIIESSRYFMYHMRCGFDIPGYHKACHLDDGQIRSKNNLLAGGKVTGHHDCSGGWHDAGDFDKFPGPTIQPAIHFSRFGKRFNSDALLDEAAWGAKWHNKIATPRGVYYQILRLAPNGQVIIDLCPPESETDNIPGNADDRAIVGPGHDIMVPWALAEHALVSKDPAFREKCFKTSQMLYNDFLNSRKKFDRNFYMFNSSMLVKTDLAYYKFTGDKKYLEHAIPVVDGTVDMVIDRIKKNKWTGIFEAHFYPWSWGIMPLEFAIEFPNEAVSAKIRKEFRPLVDDIVKHFQNSPHGFVEHSTWNYHFHNGYGSSGHGTITNLSMATLLARAAVLYNEPEWLKLSERAFHYITGINELAASQISGFGDKTVTTWIASSGIPGYATGEPVKGAVLKGITRWSGTARILPSYLSGGKSDYAIDHPAGYPAMMIAADYPMSGGPGSQEVWESLNGSTLRAVEAILDAREFFNRK